MFTYDDLENVRCLMRLQFFKQAAGKVFNQPKLNALRLYFLEKFQMGLIEAIGISTEASTNKGKFPLIRLEGIKAKIWYRVIQPEVLKAIPYSSINLRNENGKLIVDIYIIDHPTYYQMYCDTGSATTGAIHYTIPYQTTGSTTVF